MWCNPPPLLWEKISLIPVYVGSMGWEEKNSLGHNYNREDTVQHFNHPSLYQNMVLGRWGGLGILWRASHQKKKTRC